MKILNDKYEWISTSFVTRQIVRPNYLLRFEARMTLWHNVFSYFAAQIMRVQ